jgi:hypothetical protein
MILYVASKSGILGEDKKEIKRQKEALNEDDVLAELEILSSNWKIDNQRPSK